MPHLGARRAGPQRPGRWQPERAESGHAAGGEVSWHAGGVCEAEITTICCHPGGDYVFCGKQDGSVTYFPTNNAVQRGVLCRHAANVEITCIAYSGQRCLLATADQSGRVLINKITISQAGFEVVNPVVEIRSEESIVALLLDASGTRIIIQGKRSAEVWTTKERKSASRSPSIAMTMAGPSSPILCIQSNLSPSVAKPCAFALATL